MDDRTRQGFRHFALYGQTAPAGQAFSGPIPEGFTFNSPVGLCMDHHQQIWVCDTGNNRIVILDRDFKTIVAILACPEAGSPKSAARKNFHLPFHACLHPAQDRIYITDMGNGRVVAMDYGPGRFRFAFAFGDRPGNGGAPLMDPNGITLVQRPCDPQGEYSIYVNDEFFREAGRTGSGGCGPFGSLCGPENPLRNRCVRYSAQGDYLDEFRTVIDPDNRPHDLYWPQGLSSDADGNLYIANTGSYEILKCPSCAPVTADYCIPADKPVVSHHFAKKKGVGMLSIMRSVNVIGDRVFVPDHVANSISVYSLEGKLLTLIAGITPTWNHDHQQVDSLTDPLYYLMENAALISPYGICQGESKDIFLISEPFCSRILKVRIADFGLPVTPIEILTAVGGRRDEPGTRGGDPQFNCVTSVVSLKHKATGKPDPDYDPMAELPERLRHNPLTPWYLTLGETVARQYDYWFGPFSRQLLEGSRGDAARLRLNLDAGNWEIRAYLDNGNDYEPADTPVTGYFLPGNIGMAVHHPRTPLLGQLLPGTPILLVSNFTVNTVSLYQVGPFGNLINYGLPFGAGGKAHERLHGPQGMAVSDDGEVFVADALNRRMTKWRLLQTGQVVFIRSFVWQDNEDKPFTPTDVAIDADNRLFVTDQFNNRICVFDRHGASLWCYGEEGYWEEGEADGEQFMLPTSLAVDGEHLILNDLVNRALKLFRIEANTLTFKGGISLFKRTVDEGGVWMPFFLHAQDKQVYVADSTYNVVQVFNVDG